MEDNTKDLPNVDNPDGQGNQEINAINETAVLNFFKEKGREVNSLDELFKEPEKIVETKEVNPYEDILDEEDKAYLQYKKETGRTRKDYDALQVNLDEISPLEFAREKVARESGIKLTKQQIDEFIESEFGISDLNELSTSDLIKLSKYGKSIKDARLEEQAKYKQPIKPENSQTNHNSNPTDDVVQLPNGSFMKKSDYEIAYQNQIKHNEMAKEAVNSITESSFKVIIDDNGEQKELVYKYEHSDEDKSSALSVISDLGKYIQETYQNEQGFDHKSFGEDILWFIRKRRESAIPTLINKARAEGIEEVMKQRGNVNFNNNKSLGTEGSFKTKLVDINDI